ncbi:hypothetical protein BSKO_11623 [Bryopsis sp. KO-2023]|nr:hypothetical protein BSKO_11623 [Bryopsis sp. KO-2023]
MDNSAPSYDDKARRIKSLLSSYYGADEQADESYHESQQSASAGPDDASSVASGFTPRFASIDSHAFNADLFVSNMLRTARIDVLLKRHSEMSKEIKVLDSDMQMLVYENYNKFISATDTIRTMKSNVDGMGSNMDALRSIIDRVADTSNAVNSKLQKHRDHIEELNRVRLLLQKLQSVIDLPKRMRAARAEKAFSIAVDSYIEAEPLFKKYGHQGALRAVAAECALELSEIVKELEELLTDPDAESEECVRLLRLLSGNEDDLQERFLVGRRKRVEQDLVQAAVLVKSMAARAIDAPIDSDIPVDWCESGEEVPDLRHFIKSLDERVLNSLSETALAFNTAFSQASGSAPLNRKHLSDMAEIVMEGYIEQMGRALASEAAAGAIEAAQPSVEDDEAILEGGAVRFPSDWGAESLARGLMHIYADLSLLESRLPELEPTSKASALIQSTVGHHVSSCFLALTHRVMGAVLSLKEKMEHLSQEPDESVASSTFLQRGFSHICDLLQKGIASLLQGLKVYESNPKLLEPWYADFIDMIQGQIQSAFLSLLSSFLAMGGVVEAPPSSPREAAGKLTAGLKPEWNQSGSFGLAAMELPAELGGGTLGSLAGKQDSQDSNPPEPPTASNSSQMGLFLLLARLCSFLEGNVVSNSVETLATIFPGGGGVKDRPAFNPSHVIRKLGAGATELLRLYVEMHGRQLTLMIRRSVAAASWLNHKEPRGPRPVCDLMLARLKLAEGEIVQLIDDGGHRSGKRHTRGKASSRTASMASIDNWEGEGSSLERNVAKLFREKIQLCRQARFTQSSILAAIMGVGLKSLVECIRLETLGRAGLQQLQLDVSYLRPLVRRYARGPEGATIDALMDEVISAAVERSVDPTLLETALIERILGSNQP